jgi:RNA polymerase sigma-70 factor (ECF subfamily)
LDSVVRTHGRLLLARALTLTRSHADAWDLFQTTLEKALRARGPSIPSDKMASWLMVILNNGFRDEVRRYERRARVPLTDDLVPVPPSQLGEPPPFWVTVDDISLRMAVAGLPSRLRVVFELYEAGTSYQRMARLLGISVRTIATRLHRARLKLRAALVVSAPETRASAAKRRSTRARARRAETSMPLRRVASA